jgi:cytochrome c oxidase subunit 1
MYPELPSKISAIVVFLGFNLTFFPQFILGYMGMPRRYHVYPPEFQVFNVLSSAGASVLAIGFLLPFLYLTWSLKYGPKAGANPWGASTLDWQTASPPITSNFEITPVVTVEAYDYAAGEGAKTIVSSH